MGKRRTPHLRAGPGLLDTEWSSLEILCNPSGTKEKLPLPRSVGFVNDKGIVRMKRMLSYCISKCLLQRVNNCLQHSKPQCIKETEILWYRNQWPLPSFYTFFHKTIYKPLKNNEMNSSVRSHITQFQHSVNLCPVLFDLCP